MQDNWLIQQANRFSDLLFISKPCIMHFTDAPATPNTPFTQVYTISSTYSSLTQAYVSSKNLTHYTYEKTVLKVETPMIRLKHSLLDNYQDYK
jgi:hypothetical protein